jgi:predicted Zn finger-like uncharacterized protein
MRLVCPNCEAKYEVPEDAIPETGRDVQCANCGHAWFQMRPRAADPVPASPAPAAAAPAPVSEPVVETPAKAEPVVESVPETEPAAIVEEPSKAPAAEATIAQGPASDVPPAPEPEPEPAPVAEAVVEPVTTMPETAGAEDDDEASSEVPPAAVEGGAAGYAVDESVLAILREEAEREATARKAEAAKPLETQPDLGIDQAPPVAAQVQDAAEEDRGLAVRRSRLPDVEEINSTLRPADTSVDEVEPEIAPVAAEGGSSFRSGFLLVLTVAILASAVYGSADAIADAVPSLAGPLKSYVAFIDSLRLQLDGLMQSATVAINGN